MSIYKDDDTPIYEDGALLRVNPLNIRPRPGFNPRKFFGPEQEGLNASVKAEGVLQPIVISPDPEGETEFVIIAGERRWRSAIINDLEQIPAIVRLVDKDTAFRIAAIENIQRADMSVIEEADTAREIIALCDGDRDEAMRVLGWNQKKLDSRLQLLHCAESVREALTERRIRLGHAELLAGLPEQTQEGTLAKIVEEGWSVQDLAERVQQFSRDLAAASFDTAECQGCPHNSAVQASLFDMHIGTGRCSNRACFAEKTSNALQAMKADLAERYNKVALDTEARSGTFKIIMVRGSEGVGPEQYDACQGCAKHGALMHTGPGKEGTVTEDVCFDLGCHAKKVAAFSALFETKPAPAEKTGDKTSASQSVPAQRSAAKTEALPKRVIEKNNEKLKAAAATVAADSIRLGKALALSSLHRDTHAERGSLPPALAALEGHAERSAIVAAALTMTDEEMDAAMQALSQAYFSQTTSFGHDIVSTAEKALAGVKANPAEHFLLDADYLKVFTKGGIDALMKESGFSGWYDAKHGDGTYKKLLGKKVAELIEAILKSGFDFKGFVPRALAERTGSSGTPAHQASESPKPVSDDQTTQAA